MLELVEEHFHIECLATLSVIQNFLACIVSNMWNEYSLVLFLLAGIFCVGDSEDTLRIALALWYIGILISVLCGLQLSE